MDLLAALCGVVIGVVQGLIGGGGSVLGVPALIYVVGVSDPHRAIGASALAVGLSALVSLSAYVRSRHVKWRCGLAFTAAGALGAYAGSSLGMAFPGRSLVALFGALMIAVAAAMAIGKPLGGDPHVRLDGRSILRLGPFLLAYGAGVGALSGFFGIGGGFLAVPGLLAATDMPMIYAIGTSLISVSVFGLTTAANYAAAEVIDWRVAGFFLVGGALGGLLGTRLARVLAQERGALAKVFSVIVAAVGMFLIAKTPL